MLAHVHVLDGSPVGPSARSGTHSIWGMNPVLLALPCLPSCPPPLPADKNTSQHGLLVQLASVRRARQHAHGSCMTCTMRAGGRPHAAATQQQTAAAPLSKKSSSTPCTHPVSWASPFNPAERGAPTYVHTHTHASRPAPPPPLALARNSASGGSLQCSITSAGMRAGWRG